MYLQRGKNIKCANRYTKNGNNDVEYSTTFVVQIFLHEKNYYRCMDIERILFIQHKGTNTI